MKKRHYGMLKYLMTIGYNILDLLKNIPGKKNSRKNVEEREKARIVIVDNCSWVMIGTSEFTILNVLLLCSTFH